MKFFLGKKVGMTQVFTDDGRCLPATVISTPKLTVTQIRSMEKDGYSAVQVAGGKRRATNVGKAVLGHFKGTPFEFCQEFRMDDVKDAEKYTVGSEISADVFSAGDAIDATGISKGKGFQGVIKRHGFHGGPRSHGQKHCERAPGSIGGGLRVRVPKGMKMGGRMGSDTVTVKRLSILAVDAEKSEIVVSGAVPGRKGTLIALRGI
jgi:large subunit ribosomal protein L3